MIAEIVALALAAALLCWPLGVTRPPATAGRRGRRRWFAIGARHPRQSAADAGVLTGLVRAISPAVAAGVPPALAVATAASVAAESCDLGSALGAHLRDLERVARSGAPLTDAWAALARSHPAAGLEPVVRAWSLTDRLGCGLSDALRTAVAAMRESTEHRRAVRAATAGPRATMQLLTTLPVAGIGIAAFIGVNPMRLYAGPGGMTALVVGLLLLAGGRGLVRRMIARACTPGVLQ